jgi:hypothetical protein
VSDHRYHIAYSGTIRPYDQGGSTLSTSWDLVAVQDQPVGPIHSVIPLFLAGAAKYLVEFPILVNNLTEPITVGVFFAQQFGAKGPIGGSVELPAVIQPFNVYNPVVVPVSVELDTPAANGPFNVYLSTPSYLGLQLIAHASPPIYCDVTYLGTNCTDVVIPPPPPFGVWCEAFVPVTDQDIEDLIETHFDRVAALADGTWNT